MIPTLIYSFYGMNIPLPFQNGGSHTTICVVIFSLLAALLGVILLNVNSGKRIKKIRKVKKREGLLKN
jgi:Mg2+ and Co2+ transporter CorA